MRIDYKRRFRKRATSNGKTRFVNAVVSAFAAHGLLKARMTCTCLPGINKTDAIHPWIWWNYGMSESTRLSATCFFWKGKPDFDQFSI